MPRVARCCAAVMASVVMAPPAFAAGLAFIRASSEREEPRGDAGRYHPLNLLDEDPATVWCAARGARGGVGESVTIAWKSPQRVVRIVVNPASVGRPVEAVRITAGSSVITMQLGEGPATLAIRRPLVADRFEVTIAELAATSVVPRADAAGAAGPAGPGVDSACLGDVLLYTTAGLFGSRSKHSGLRYDVKLARVVGVWNGGALGAPDRELSFALDGSWEWSLTPLLGGRAQHKSGEYRFRGDRLLMRVGEAGRWADMRLRWRRVAVDGRAMGAALGDYDTLWLADLLGAPLGGEYNNARF